MITSLTKALLKSGFEGLIRKPNSSLFLITSTSMSGCYSVLLLCFVDLVSSVAVKDNVDTKATLAEIALLVTYVSGCNQPYTSC